MSIEEPFGRQLLPVMLDITGGDREDREHWIRKIRSYLVNQPCTLVQTSFDKCEHITIHPDANND